MLKKCVILCIVAGLFALMNAVNASWADDCIDPPSGLVSWWPGDGNANDIEDGNDGTLHNGATYASGKVEQAFSFDGMDDYVEVTDPGSGSNLDLGRSFTLDAWIFNKGPGSNFGDGYRNYRIILLKRSLLANVWVYGMRLNPGNATGDPFQGVITDPSGSAVFVTTTERVPRNAWSHVAMTYDGISLKLYINGVEKASVSTSITLETNNEPVRIGNWNHLTYANIQHFKGLIDEVEILDRALTAGQIEDIYEAGSAGKCKPCLTPPSNLVSWWPGDGNADDIEDGNDGTMYNGAGFAAGKVDQAFSFDGVDDYVDGGSGASLKFGTRDFTVEGWINPNSLAGAGGARWFVARHSSADNVGFRFGTWRDKLVYRDRSTYVDVFGSLLTTGVWTHIAAVREGTGVNQLKLYVDGVLDAEGTSAGNFNDDSPFYIGRPGEPFVNIDYFDGLIDEVEIFNRALLAPEILAIYNAGSAGKCKPISVYVDIKPTSCPNPLNVKSGGVLPVAILGSEGYDVSQIDPLTVTLASVLAIPGRDRLEDVAAPVVDPQEECECTEEGPDGFVDLTLKFDKELIIKALPEVNDGDTLVLTLTGNLKEEFGGTAIKGEDCVVIIKKKEGKGGPKSAGVVPSTPMVFALHQNNPNPFARETSISYNLPASGHTTLKIYDTSGRLVTTLMDAEMSAGVYSTTWNRKNAASGIYFYRLTTGGSSLTKAMTVLR